MISEESVKQCLKMIVANREKPALNYAVNYARVGLSQTGYELKVQCLYVLSNMQYWRGNTAKHVRSVLKEFTKEMSK